MPSGKARCIYCGKKIEKNLEFCNKCGRDIRSMWEPKSSNQSAEKPIALFCPNPRCHAPYTEGDVFCIQCRNDYTKHPPIQESEFYKKSSKSEHMYCPECGELNDNNDLFCDCGCDFRLKPRIPSPPKRKKVFYCAACGLKEVSIPDGICGTCKQKAVEEYCLCPECKTNKVKKFGEICIDCLKKKPLKGMGEGFHFPR